MVAEARTSRSHAEILRESAALIRRIEQLRAQSRRLAGEIESLRGRLAEIAVRVDQTIEHHHPRE